MITLQVAQQLKTKNINIIPGQLFCRQCKAQFLLEAQIDCIKDEDKGLFVTDNDDELTEYQTARKKLQSMAIPPVNLRSVPQHRRITNAKMKFDKVMNTIKSNISEAYKAQVSDSDSYDKNDKKEKATELVRLHKAIQEKLKTASYSEQIQILTLVPDNWSRKYCSEYFNAFEYLAWTEDEIKKIGGILVKPAPKNVKTITNETLHLVTNIYVDDDFSR